MPTPPDAMLIYVRDILFQLIEAAKYQMEIKQVEESMESMGATVSQTKVKERKELLQKMKRAIRDQNFYSIG